MLNLNCYKCSGGFQNRNVKPIFLLNILLSKCYSSVLGYALKNEMNSCFQNLLCHVSLDKHGFKHVSLEACECVRTVTL